MLKFFKVSRLPIFALGMILFLAGERYFSTESYALVLRSVAFVALCFGLFETWYIAGKAKHVVPEHLSWRMALSWQALIILGAIIYVAYTKVLGSSGVPDSFMDKALLAAWILCFVLGISLAIGIELALIECVNGKFSEPTRIKRAGKSWLAVGLLLSFLININYTGYQKDKVYDWSYLKATEPSASTKSLISALTDADKLDITVFYPKGNPVLAFVSEYFSALERVSKNVKVAFVDKDLQPALAGDLKVSRNGTVVLSKGEQREKINIGTSIRSARKTLSKLDSEFQKAFLGLSARSKVAYFTRGHGELSWSGQESNPLKKIANIEAWLRGQNYNMKTLDIASGSAKEIPSDASVVVIAGPTRAFSPEEVSVLREYLEKGGRAFVLLDSEKDLAEVSLYDNSEQKPLVEYLRQIGIEYDPTPLANESNYLRGTKTKLDHWFLYSNSFTSHESVSSLTKNDEKVAVLAIQAGSLTLKKKANSWDVFETVRSLRDTFKDLNKNYVFDSSAGEEKKSYTMGAGAKLKTQNGEGRLVVFADASVISDGVLRNPGNLLYTAGALSWLIGTQDSIAVAASEEDVKILHSKKENLFVFYGSVVFVPLLVLIIGAFVNRRKKITIVEDTNHAA
ncbi:MAG: Gldg family protein [Bdellovibrionota bacterium]